jgi:hypothetical protein
MQSLRPPTGFSKSLGPVTRFRCNKAFPFIETSTVLAIIAIGVAMGLPGFDLMKEV